MTCRLSSDSPHLMPCGASPVVRCNASYVIAWRRAMSRRPPIRCPGDHLQVINSPHESDALQIICGAEVGQEKTDSVAGR